MFRLRLVTAVNINGERGKDKCQDIEYIGLDKADEQLECHKKWQSNRRHKAGQCRDDKQQDFTRKCVTE